MAEEKSTTGAAVTDVEMAPTRTMQLDRGYAVQLIGPHVGAENVDCHINVLKAGADPGPYHYHSNAENAYLVLEGQVRVRIDGVDHDAPPGTAVFIPPGVPHSATNIGTSDARLIEIYAPPNPDFIWVEDVGATP